MAVIGLVVGRLRSSYTLISRNSLSNVASGSTGVYLPEAVVRSRLISHSGIQTASIPAQIIEAIHACLSEFPLGDAGHQFGILASGTVEFHSGQSRDKNVELAKRHGIVCHELSKTWGISEVSIQEIRLALGIKIPRQISSKAELASMFLQHVSDRSECAVNTGVQCMSESWGVARLIERRRLLAELKAVYPLEDSSLMGKKYMRMDPSMREELMRHETDKILIERFSL